MFRVNFFTFVLALSALAWPQHARAQAVARNYIGIYEQNVWNGSLDANNSDDPRGYDNRIYNMALLFGREMKARGLAWDLAGFSELAHHNALDLNRTIEVADKRPCQYTEISMYTPECFATTLRGNKAPQDYTNQFGQMGVMANKESVILLEAFSGLLGYAIPGTPHREVVGGRFLLKESGYILPFFSTHIADHSSTNDMNRHEQVEDLTQKIEAWWKPGDLCPVVVGDFNASYNDPYIYSVMEKDFVELGVGKGWIDQIWLGKSSSFPGNYGETPAFGIGIHRMDSFCDRIVCHTDSARNDPKYSDHPGYFGQLSLPSEDCVYFTPGNLVVQQQGSTWVLLDGTHGVAGFPTAAEANRALAVIRNYGLTTHCFGIRPNPVFEYWLSRGEVPRGSMSGEDCLPWNTARLEVRQVNGDWRIMEGELSDMSFGTNEGDARRALALIKKYGFDETCFVGRPDPSFVYYRTQRPVTGLVRQDLGSAAKVHAPAARHLNGYLLSGRKIKTR
jgi:hypothetical protein